MTTIFLIVLILASVILSLIVLIQNPKGGGLAGSMAGLSNQFMGVKQTTDVLEKGTWLFGGIIAVLCLLSSVFIGTSDNSGSNRVEDVGPAKTQQSSGPGLPTNTPPPSVPVDTPK